jgi:hypothetical protein
MRPEYQKLTSSADRPELGHLAQWTVSSHKYGFGVENLRDGNDNTFWQYVSLPMLSALSPRLAGCTGHKRDTGGEPLGASRRDHAEVEKKWSMSCRDSHHELSVED